MLYNLCFISHKLPFNTEIYRFWLKKYWIFFVKVVLKIEYLHENSVAPHPDFGI